MSNGQTYFVATKKLVDFINGTSFEYKNNSEISRAAGLSSARTAKNAVSGNRVSSGTAKAVHKLCTKQGFEGSLQDAFNEVS